MAARVGASDSAIPPRRLRDRDLQSLRHPPGRSASHPARYRAGVAQPGPLLYVGGGAGRAAAADRCGWGGVVLYHPCGFICVLLAALWGRNEVGNGVEEEKGG
jgi:hypothetical protein